MIADSFTAWRPFTGSSKAQMPLLVLQKGRISLKWIETDVVRGSWGRLSSVAGSCASLGLQGFLYLLLSHDFCTLLQLSGLHRDLQGTTSASWLMLSIAPIEALQQQRAHGCAWLCLQYGANWGLILCLRQPPCKRVALFISPLLWSEWQWGSFLDQCRQREERAAVVNMLWPADLA